MEEKEDATAKSQAPAAGAGQQGRAAGGVAELKWPVSFGSSCTNICNNTANIQTTHEALDTKFSKP